MYSVSQQWWCRNLNPRCWFTVILVKYFDYKKVLQLLKNTVLFELKDLEKNLELSGSSFQRELHSKKKKVYEAQEENRVLQEELHQLNQKLKVGCEAIQVATRVLTFYLWKYL